MCAMYRSPSHIIVKSAVSSPSTRLLCLVFGLLGVGGTDSALETGDALQCGVVGSNLASDVASKEVSIMIQVVIEFGIDQCGCLALARVL